MIAKMILLGGAVLVGVVCVGLFITALLYLAYCVIAPRPEKHKTKAA